MSVHCECGICGHCIEQECVTKECIDVALIFTCVLDKKSLTINQIRGMR